MILIRDHKSFILTFIGKPDSHFCMLLDPLESARSHVDAIDNIFDLDFVVTGPTHPDSSKRRDRQSDSD